MRDEAGKLLPGVWLEDLGHKIGLNGVDNARIKFTNMRVPKDCMLNRNSDVTAEGKYVSDIKKRRDRFLKVADRLLSGRICIGAMTISATKLCLSVCFRFGQKRMAVGKDGKSNSPIIDFNLFQNALYPLLAKTVALNIVQNKIKDVYVENMNKPTS